MKKFLKKFLKGCLETFIILVVCSVIFGACVKAFPDVQVLPKWEYKIVYVPAANNSTALGTTIKIDEVGLTADGKNGWELITSYEEYNTVFPNFSADTKVVTGIESNVRPLQLVLLFKRPLP